MSGPEHIALGGAAETRQTERASATPSGAIEERAPVDLRGLPPVPADLPTTLDWFTRVIMSPHSVQDGRARASEIEARLGVRSLEQLVTRSSRQDASARLGVYRHAYLARLVECLADDFAFLAQALGERFEALARAYVERHPSDHRNLVYFGRHFSRFLAEQPGIHPAWIELAKVEWAMTGVMHAPAPAPLDLGRIAALSPLEQERLVLVPSLTLRVLFLDYPLNAFLKALSGAIAPAGGLGRSLPEAIAPTPPSPGFEALAIYRHGDRIWRMALGPQTAKLLGALVSGEPLGAALAKVDEGAAADVDVMAWFQDWMASGFFSDFRLY